MATKGKWDWLLGPIEDEANAAMVLGEMIDVAVAGELAEKVLGLCKSRYGIR